MLIENIDNTYLNIFHFKPFMRFEYPYIMPQMELNIRMMLKHNLTIKIVCIYSYENLWCAPIVLVGHSFGGLIIKSLVVEIQRCMNKKPSNDIESAGNERSKDFYDNLTGVIFYGAPHEGGTKAFSMYFEEICQEVGLLNKTHSITQQSFLENVQVLNPKMEQLSVEFDRAKENLNIYAFVEGQPINKDEVFLNTMTFNKYAN
jgi:hypothetical protein